MCRWVVLALCVSALSISACRSTSAPTTSQTTRSPRQEVQKSLHPGFYPEAASAAIPTPPEPQYGWNTLIANKVEFQPLNGEQISIPNHAKIRVTVNADSGVFGGVFYRQLLEAQLRQRRILRRPIFQIHRVLLSVSFKGK